MKILPKVLLLVCTLGGNIRVALGGRAGGALRSAVDGNLGSTTEQATLGEEDGSFWNRYLEGGDLSIPPTLPPTPTPEPDGICFIVYQMADNNLDEALREDLAELISSEAIRSPSMTTWVYFDPFTWDPLGDVWRPDGSERVTNPYPGSRYLTWSHSLGKMILQNTLGEQNSDSEETMFQFIMYALKDCVAKNKKEYFMAFSDHGGGAFGYGGDDNLGQGRKLVAHNIEVVTAMKQALQFVPGAPEVFDVLGFDACSMMALGTMDDYDASVAKYFLASEALEPGSGWPYDKLTKTGSALELAIDVYEQYLLENEEIPFATMAIADAEKFGVFLDSFELLSAELSSVIDSASDPGLSTAVYRAQEVSIDFGFWYAEIDIGSYLENLNAICAPVPGSQLESLIATTQVDYNDMFVVQGISAANPGGTGMHVLFPNPYIYFAEQQTLDEVLFLDPFIATLKAPNWLSFMKSFYFDETPWFGPSTACTLYEDIPEFASPSPAPGTVAPGVPAPTPSGPLIINPVLTTTAAGEFTTSSSLFLLEADINPTASVIAQYGVAVSRPEGVEYIYAGELLSTFEGLTWSTTWDNTFYLIGEGVLDAQYLLYVENLGEGTKSANLMYFAPGTISEGTDTFGLTFEEAEALGGMRAVLRFTTFNDVQLLFASGNGFTFTEILPSNGGFIVPIVRKGEYPYEFVLGAFSNALIPWTEGIQVFPVSAAQFAAFVDDPSEAIISLAAESSQGQTQEEIFGTRSYFNPLCLPQLCFFTPLP